MAIRPATGNRQFPGELEPLTSMAQLPAASNPSALYAANRAETETGDPEARSGDRFVNAALGSGSKPTLRESG